MDSSSSSSMFLSVDNDWNIPSSSYPSLPARLSFPAAAANSKQTPLLLLLPWPNYLKVSAAVGL